MDSAWWMAYGAEAKSAFAGEFWAPITFPGVRKARFNCFRNSGAGAIALAAKWGAEQITLLGYDGQKTGGRAHWHGDHPAGLGNAGSVDKWPGQFQELAKHLGRINVINCSRETVHTVFPRRPLHEVLL